MGNCKFCNINEVALFVKEKNKSDSFEIKGQ